MASIMETPALALVWLVRTKVTSIVKTKTFPEKNIFLGKSVTVPQGETFVKGIVLRLDGK